MIEQTKIDEVPALPYMSGKEWEEAIRMYANAFDLIRIPGEQLLKNIIEFAKQAKMIL